MTYNPSEPRTPPERAPKAEPASKAEPEPKAEPKPDRVIAALADPTRRSLLEALRGGEASVGALAQAVPVSRPAVSQHLRVLCDAGLLTVRRDGTRRVYRLAPDGAAALRAWLDAMWADALTDFAAAAHRTPRRKD